MVTRQGSVLEAARQITRLFPFCFVSNVFSVGPFFTPVTSRTAVNSSTDAAKTLNPFSLRGDSVRVGPPSLAILAIGLN